MLCKGLVLTGFETKEVSDDVATFTGIASTSDVDLADDIIEPGAFGKIDAKHVAMLRDHNPSKLIGGWNQFEQDGKNLKVEGAISLGIDIGRETYTLMKQGFLSGLSVGFRINKGGVTFDETNGIRRIKRAKLIECSVVSVPAQPKARVRSVKSLLESRDSIIEWLADNGFDDEEIAVIATKGFDALLRGEKAGGIRIFEVDGFRKSGTAGTDAAPLDAAIAAVRGLLNDVKGPSHVT